MDREEGEEAFFLSKAGGQKGGQCFHRQLLHIITSLAKRPILVTPELQVKLRHLRVGNNVIIFLTFTLGSV